MDTLPDDCITVCLRYTSGDWDKLTSIFIKREGHDPTEEDLKREQDRMCAARNEGFELMAKRLLEETGTEPDFGHVHYAFYEQLKDPKHISDYTPYYRWDQDPAWPTTKKYPPPTSKSNPVDLTGSISSATNTSTKKQELDLRQTNTGSVRSSPPRSTQPPSLSTTNQPEQDFVPNQTQSDPTEALPNVHLETNFTASMSEPGRSKVKAVARRSTMPTSSTKDARSRLTAETAAKTSTKVSSQPLAKQHTNEISEDLTNDFGTKSSPPSASTRRQSGRTSSTGERLKMESQ